MINLKLISHTQDPERVIAMAGKLCYSSSNIKSLEKNLTQENIEKFVNRLVGYGHLSPLEHVSFTFALEGVSRAETHQQVRHRIGSYCLSGDTEIITDYTCGGTNKRTIQELYDMKKQYRDLMHIRSINEETLEIVKNKMVDVVQSGIKKLYEVETEDGYKILTTLEHRYFTPNGWKQLLELNPGDEVFTDGIPAYRNKECVKPSKIKSITYIKEDMTYDIEMQNPYHNFVANGFVVHNSQQSQRYVNLENNFEYITPDIIFDMDQYHNCNTNEYEFEQDMETIHNMYVKWQHRFENFIKDTRYPTNGMTPQKVANENARAVLPNACETKIIFTYNFRTIINFVAHRKCHRAQSEINQVATLMEQIISKQFPILGRILGAPCEFGKCPEGNMTCGQPFPKKDLK